MAALTLDHLSYSSVSTYSDCGMKFFLRKQNDVKRIPSWAAMGGSAVHKATEILDFQDFGIQSIPDDVPDTAQGHAAVFSFCLNSEIQDAIASGVPREDWHAGGRKSKEWPDKENEDWWRQHGPLFVSGWRGWLRRSGFTIYLPAGGEPAIEVAYRVEIGGFPAVGYIDRVMEDSNGELLIVDIKSGREPHGIDQLRDYGVALSRSVDWTGPTPKWGAYYMARDAGCTIPVALTGADGTLRDWVYSKALTGIRNGVFLPNVGLLCKSCNVKEFCPAWTGKVVE